jgi:hypothetical protein
MFNALTTCIQSSGYSPGLQLYCEDNIQYDIPENVKYQVITGCSKIKKTPDELFEYVIADNKVYILSVDYIKLNEQLAQKYPDTPFKMLFPDTIENKPVVSLNGCIFPQKASSVFSSNSHFSQGFDEIHLPNQLEVLGGQCFSSMFSTNSSGIKLKIPDSLKIILGTTGTSSSYNDSFYGTWFDLSPNIEEGIFYLPALENFSQGALNNLLGNLNSSILPDEEGYIQTKTNPYAYYVNLGYNSSDIEIQEGCEHIGCLYGNFATISLPSTLKTLASVGNSSLTTITFADTIIATEIPSSFANNCSNSSFTKVILPEGIQTIGEGAFSYSSNLKDITLPSTITFIASMAFYEGYGVSNLNKVVKIKAKTPPRLYSTSSIVCTKNNLSKVIVPRGCLDAYKKASNWSTWADRMEESTEW